MANIEKENLEAHVELCTERYRTLKEKLDSFDTRMAVLEGHVAAIHTAIASKAATATEANNKMWFKAGITLLGILSTAVFSLLIHLINK